MQHEGLIDRRIPPQRPVRAFAWRLGAVTAAVGVHGVLCLMLNGSSPSPTELDARAITVALITRPPPLPAPATREPKTQTKPIDPPPDTPPEPLTEPNPQQSVVRDPTPATQTAPSSPQDVTPAPKPDSSGQPVPDQWRLDPGAQMPLDKTQLAQALDCPSGFDVGCAAQRKALFADEQLTETELVWSPAYAHSGLSNSDLYGLSEAEIRKRLGIPTAGQNAFMILPGIGIDGPWWDALHGVNKACDYSVRITDDGERVLSKTCGGLKPATRSLK